MIHALGFIVTLYREILDAKSTFFGQMMKCAEVITIGLYFSVIYECLDYWMQWTVLREYSNDIVADNLIARHKSDLLYRNALEHIMNLKHPDFF